VPFKTALETFTEMIGAFRCIWLVEVDITNDKPHKEIKRIKVFDIEWKFIWNVWCYCCFSLQVMVCLEK